MNPKQISHILPLCECPSNLFKFIIVVTCKLISNSRGGSQSLRLKMNIICKFSWKFKTGKSFDF